MRSGGAGSSVFTIGWVWSCGPGPVLAGVGFGGGGGVSKGIGANRKGTWVAPVILEPGAIPVAVVA